MDKQQTGRPDPAPTTALVSGGTAATAGTFWSAGAIARRNRAETGNALNPVMKTAVTACELAHRPAAEGEEEAG